MAARRKIDIILLKIQEKHNNDTQQLEIKISVQNHPEEKKGRNFISKNQNETLGSSEKPKKKKAERSGH